MRVQGRFLDEILKLLFMLLFSVQIFHFLVEKGRLHMNRRYTDMKYSIVLDLKAKRACLPLPAGEDLAFAKKMAAIMRSNPELNVLGIIDQDDNIVEGYDNFINYLNSFK